MKVVPCTSCGAPVIWAKSLKNEWIAVDATPNPSGNVVLQTLASEVLLARVLGAPALAESMADKYVSHFSACRGATPVSVKR